MASGILDRLLDASVVASFDRRGFRRHARAFDPPSEERSLSGAVCLVTGANSGIGLATARGLAARGARVWMLCRDVGKGAVARDGIRAAHPRASLVLARLDVADLDAVRRFVADLPEERVDVLVHNAGVLPAERTGTKDGLELTLATHVVGPHLCTRLLETRLAASPDARTIFVSSGGMLPVRLSCDDPGWETRPFDGVQAYAQTKRMQVVLAELFAARWSGSGRGCHAMHPGWAETPSVRSAIPRFHRVMERWLRTPEEGADTVVWLAAARRERVGSGGFWFDRERRATHWLPWTRETPAERLRLWALCERLAGLRDVA